MSLEQQLVPINIGLQPVGKPLFPSHVGCMKQSDIFRENADNCLQLAERAEGQPAFRRYSRMAQAWTALAEEQDWLDGEVPPLPIPHSPDSQPAP
jgi:hypothetical protein